MSIAQLPQPSVAGDRREHPRAEHVRPCKVFSAALQKYFLGETIDVSSGGMQVRIGQLVDVRPGDVVHVGVANKRREGLLRAADMLEATVTRSVKTVNDHTVFALRFQQEQRIVDETAMRLAA